LILFKVYLFRSFILSIRLFYLSNLIFLWENSFPCLLHHLPSPSCAVRWLQSDATLASPLSLSHTHTHTHTHIHTYTHIHTHIHTHTYIHTLSHHSFSLSLSRSFFLLVLLIGTYFSRESKIAIFWNFGNEIGLKRGQCKRRNIPTFVFLQAKLERPKTDVFGLKTFVLTKALQKMENSKFCTFAKIEIPNFPKFSEITKILRHNWKFRISQKNMEYSEENNWPRF